MVGDAKVQTNQTRPKGHSLQETLACLALGSNQGDRRAYLENAIEAISSISGCHLDLRSKIYETSPWGVEDQPNFLNAVCGLYCSISPRTLLTELQKIEMAGGRTRQLKWGPRTLDIDIICFGDIEMNITELRLPHPLFKERRFVLEPLAEIYPQLVIDNLSVLTHLNNLDR